MVRRTLFRSISLTLAVALLAVVVGCQQKSNEERFLESHPPGVAPGPGDSVGGGSNPNTYEGQGYPGASEVTPKPSAEAPTEGETATPPAEAPEGDESAAPAPDTQPAAPSLEPPATEEAGETP